MTSAGTRSSGPLAAGLEQDSIAGFQQLPHQRHQFALLEHGLATGNFDEAAVGAETLHLVPDFFGSHLASALERVLAVAPGAAQVTAGEPHEDAGQPSVRRLTLQRFVDFGYLHLRVVAGATPALSAKPKDLAARPGRPPDSQPERRRYDSEYFAVVVSVSNTVTSFTRTRPLVTLFSRVFDSS